MEFNFGLSTFSCVMLSLRVMSKKLKQPKNRVLREPKILHKEYSIQYDGGNKLVIYY